MPDGTGTPRFFSVPKAHVLVSTRLFPSIRATETFEAPWILRNVSSDRRFSVNASSRGYDVSYPLFPTVTISESDFGSSASHYRGPRSTHSSYPSHPRRFQGSYVAPSTVMSQPYYATSYAPSGATSYSGYSTGAYQAPGSATERTYFSLNGKLVRSYKVRSYRVRLLAHRSSTSIMDLIDFFISSHSEPKNMSSIYFPTCCKALPLPASNSL